MIITEQFTLTTIVDILSVLFRLNANSLCFSLFYTLFCYNYRYVLSYIQKEQKSILQKIFFLLQCHKNSKKIEFLPSLKNNILTEYDEKYEIKSFCRHYSYFLGAILSDYFKRKVYFRLEGFLQDD